MSDNRTNYDVIIVGGGPAGSTAGYLLSQNGFNVALLDKDKFPRPKLCGGLLTLKTLSLLSSIFDETERSLINERIIDFRSNYYEVFYRNRVLAKGLTELPFFFVDRRTYDDFLLKKAKRAGVKVLEGERVRSVNLVLNEVQTSTEKILRAKYIIGADGANSIVRKEMLSDRDVACKWQHNLGTALEIFLDRKDIAEKIDHPMVYFGFVNWGYSWVFPNKERIVIGLGGLNRKNRSSLVSSFHNFVSSIEIQREKTLSLVGSLVPCGNFLLTPIRSNTMIVGDAAGFVDPILGEGIFYAQKSAELASYAIIRSERRKEKLNKCYLELLWKDLYPRLIYAEKFRSLIFGGLNEKSDYCLAQILFKALNKKIIELVHGRRTYRLLMKNG